MTKRRRNILLASVAALGAVVAVVMLTTPQSRGEGSSRPVAGLPFAVVRRTNLVNSQLIPGTIGYRALPAVANHLPGLYTYLPQPGSLVRPGEVLYRVNDVPAVLMSGTTPAWRELSLGVAPGPDISELNHDLESMGYLKGFEAPTPSDSFTIATEIAVTRWQRALEVPITGTVPLGMIVFRPSSLRVGSLLTTTDESADSGASPFTVTSAGRAVVASISTANASEARKGASVRIQLPNGGSLPGRIVALSQSLSGSAHASTVAMTIVPTVSARLGNVNQAPVEVGLTTSVARHVLAVPVTALLALAGGGYGVQIERRRSTKLIPVRTGLFSTGLVEVHAGELKPGTRVVVSQ